MSRQPARRQALALPGYSMTPWGAEELDPPDVIPEGSVLVAGLRWAASPEAGQGPGRRFGVIGLYQVDHARETCRPRCTCNWTTEGPALFWREAVDRLDLVEGRCSCQGDVLPACQCGAQTLERVLRSHADQHHAIGLQLARG